MRLLILGGSNAQVNAIARAKRAGHTVVVSDYLPDAPGKALADYTEMTSTFDVAGMIDVAHRYRIDGVLTIGTDQPVYTAARVAEELRLPALISAPVAKAVTNKRIMKAVFSAKGIPTAKYRLLSETFLDSDLDGLAFPIVVKPVDSQGQRGVYKLESASALREVFSDVLGFSREDRVLVEEFYQSNEITVSGWVVDNRAYIISIVDRISSGYDRHIGICTSHRFPSRYTMDHYDEIADLTEHIVSAFEIHNGPVYFQILVGPAGLKVNEIACRIGGAYEDEYLLKATGIDILELLIQTSLGQRPDYSKLQSFDLRRVTAMMSVEMLFVRAGMVQSLGDIEAVRRSPGVVQAKFSIKPGQVVQEMLNATQRVGYMILEGKCEADLKSNLELAYKQVMIFDGQGENMLRRFCTG